MTRRTFHRLVTAATAATGPTEPPGPPRPTFLPDRYELVGRIAEGGMGEVLRVHDRLLDRELAMKVIAHRLAADPRTRARFVAEANLNARLQHPGIVPVHDRGELADGRLWFTMPEVRGRTLAALIHDVHEAAAPHEWRGTPSGWSFRRLIDSFASACQAVAYAHSRGVLHRDLKPANIMVGAFGEVQVMDWGVAALLGAEPGPTRTNEVTGTPAFMAPEQAAGDAARQGPWTDVYALGAVLYELLSGCSPYSGSYRAVLTAIAAGPPLPLAERLLVDHPPIPEELAELCARAMSRDPDARPRDAGAVAESTVAWLDGERRRDRARAVVLEAAPLARQAAQLRARAESLREEAGERLAGLAPNAPVDRKAPAWELEDHAADAAREAELAETRWLQALQGALEIEPALAEAHAALADHHQAQLAAAEAARDGSAAARHEVLLRAHDRGRHAAWLSREGTLSLTTATPARVTVLPLIARRRRLEPGPPIASGLTTPIDGLRLPIGSYILQIASPGCAAFDLPVLIERGGHWTCTDPEGRLRQAPAPRHIGSDEVFVAGGWTTLGGDPDAADALPPRRWWIDDLVVRRHPVTVEEYIPFLDDLLAQGRVDEAASYTPIERGTVATSHATIERIGDRHRPGTYGNGERVRPRDPVVYVHHGCARAYAAWLSARTGRPWRLPHDHEWEKFARGVDGRRFPWGDHFDATWACTARTRDTAPILCTVDEFPDDVGPYGVRGLAGNVREWCLNPYRREGPGDGGRLVVSEEPITTYAVVRGGAYVSAPGQARSAARFAARPDERLLVLGFRLVHPCPPE